MARVATLAANVTADIGELKLRMHEAEKTIERMTSRARTQGRNFDRTMQSANRSSGQFGRGIQNAAFQVGDFAVQVGGGTSAVRAMSMQLPQLLGGFGVMGAVLGATVAILGPFVQHLWDSSDAASQAAKSANDLENAIGELASARSGIQQLVGLQESLNVAMADSARVSSQSTAVIIANTEREFKARQKLIEVRDLPEAQRQIDQYVSQIAEARREADELGSKLERLRTLSSQRSAAGLETGTVIEDFGRLNQDRKSITAEVNVLEAQMELALIRAQELEEALGLVFDPTGGAAAGGSVSAGGGRSAVSPRVEQIRVMSEELQRLTDLTKGNLAEQLGAWSGYFSGLGSMMQSENDKMLRIAKAFGAAQTLVNAWKAYGEVLADPAFIGRPWARIAAAGQVLAAGLGAVNAIKGVSAGGGSSGGAGAAAGGAAGPNFSQAVAITLEGSESATFSKSQVRDLINQINEAVEGGAIVRLA